MLYLIRLIMRTQREFNFVKRIWKVVRKISLVVPLARPTREKPNRRCISAMKCSISGCAFQALHLMQPIQRLNVDRVHAHRRAFRVKLKWLKCVISKKLDKDFFCARLMS